MKRYLFLYTLLCCSLLMWAQRPSEASDKAKTAGEGEINLQQEFFDPTRKETKQQEAYVFSTDWRLEIGYVQNQQRSKNNSYSNPFLHGAKLGATVDFNLPYHFSVQTGLAFCVTYGQIEQHWRSLSSENVQKEYIRHGFNQYYLEVPARVYYNQKLWKELNMFFFAGPKMQIGLAEMDWQKQHLSEEAFAWLESEGVFVHNYNRLSNYNNGNPGQMERELRRCNIQLGLGGGMEWAQYRVVAGYDFGLNNLVYHKPVPSAHMWQWGWYVSFAYRL